MGRIVALSAVLICAFTLACWRTAPQNSGPDANSADEFANITDPAQALALGDQYLDNNETEKAIGAYTRATDLNPDLADAWFKLGIAYGLVEKAQELEAKTDVNAPDNQPTGKPNSEKAFRRAVEAYKKQLAQNDSDDAAWFNLGRAYNKLNEDQDAAKALKQAVKLKPDDSEYQTELGAILIKLAQYHEAIPPLKKALDLDPDNSRAADLLDDAEAGRNRVDYTPPKKDANTNANANANVNANANSNSATNTGTKPTTMEKPTPKSPENPTPKPTIHL
ncbi:MAG TPA: tetratricopeptide repeat protein [Pyrinomonadaceae bacterium]|jgi:cytochrome c-type biogenesis protein CcmH/NrfG